MANGGDIIMKWTDIPSGHVNRAFQRLMVAFGDRADTIVKRINTDESLAPRVATLCYHNGYEASASQAKAREIMGRNFFGIEEAQRHFGVILSKWQIAYMADVPFSEEVLKECKDTHLLVAYAPMSIVAVRTKTAGVKLPLRHRMFYQQSWYDGSPVGNYAGILGWFLVGKTARPNSRKSDKTHEANVIVYTVVGHYLDTGERLFEKSYVHTSTLDEGGYYCVCVGVFGDQGIRIDRYVNTT